MATEHSREVLNDRSTVTPPGSHVPIDGSMRGVSEPAAVIAPAGPRVRWGGVMSGFVVALGVLMLLTALGLAVGLTALEDPRAMTGETASDLGVGAGVWAFFTLCVALFLAGMISTQVTDQPDRGGAVIHGVLVWVLFSVFLLWLIGSGVRLGVSGLFGAVGGLTRGATTAATAAVSGGDLTQTLGLDHPDRILDRLNDPQSAALLATATGMTQDEARTALGDLRTRVAAVREDPAQVTAEVKSFLAQYAARAKQQALTTAAVAKERAATGSWVTFGVMAVTLVVAIVGALSGTPSGRQWRARLSPA
jgi:hypothetical protein